MTLSIALFELRRRSRLLSTWVYVAVFFGLAFLAMTATGGVFQNVAVLMGDRVYANCPFSLFIITLFLGFFATIMTAAIFGRAIQQDFEHDASALFFTRPVTKAQYVGGRFLGALLTCLGILTSVGVGSWLATKMPWMPPEKLGPTSAWAYVQPYLVALLPNLLFTGAIFFGTAALTRKMTPVYVTSVLLVVGYTAATAFIQGIDNKTLGSLVDPFGITAVVNLTNYWTVAERNARLVPLEGVLLVNRLLWLGVGSLIFGFTAWRFSFSHAPSERAAPEREAPKPGPAAPVRSPSPDFRGAYSARLLPRLTWMHFRETVKNVYFFVIALGGVALLLVVASKRGQFYDTPTYPVTGQLIEIFSTTFNLFLLAVITFSSGELIWRERVHQFAQIHDALPIRSWLSLLSKALALTGAVAVLLLLVFLTCVGLQVMEGYHQFEVGLYLRGLLGLGLFQCALIVVLAVCVQSLVSNKYVGHMIMVGYYVLEAVGASLFGFEHKLWLYGGTPSHAYSDMNGYGHLWRGALWFDLLWAVVAVGLALASHLLWVRGVETSLAVRWRLAKDRFTRPVRVAVAVTAGVALVLVAWILYNTRALNTYTGSAAQDDLSARYEKRYKVHQDEPQPKVTAIQLDADLFPSELRARLSGTYTLLNKTKEDVRFVYLNLPPAVKVHALALGVPSDTVLEDAPVGFRALQLKTPLHPGESTSLRFDLEYAHQGFESSPTQLELVQNGIFMDETYLPKLGYLETSELLEDSKRKKHGLAPKERMKPADDPKGILINAVDPEADFIDFAATLSTDPDQLAIAPGYLQREWVEGGRRHFEYKMDAPIIDIVSIQSGRYAVKRDAWNGVTLEVYYHPAHAYNVDRMIEAAKASLDYFTAAYGPYQHKQFRIIEYPRYKTYAESLPNTVPYSEAIGFIARPDPSNDRDVDFPYYATAHEMAHQWWAHQEVPANVRGASFVTESLAEYSALMVLKRKYGDHQIGRFLRHELDDYLVGRWREPKQELPLQDVEDQAYIHYRKGGLALYALQDYIGEDKVSAALKAFLEETRFQGPPYATSRQLMAQLEKVTPEQYRYLLEDMFRTITLYENHAESATARKLPDGRYEVTIRAKAKKLRATGLGAEKETSLSDWIEFGALDAHGNALVLEKRLVTSSPVEVKLVVDKLPEKAGIDPLNKLLDRDPTDNAVRVSVEEEST